MKIKYKDYKFKADSLKLIEQANGIIADYKSQGYSLTLRQLYYQFVSKNWLKNSQKSYDNLGAIISKARIAGLVDWEAIEDRTRNLRGKSHWDSPLDYMTVSASGYHMDMWENQEVRPEVWIEKDALIGVIEDVCDKWDVPYFACRGYSSQSETWRAGQRFQRHIENGQRPLVIHLGDHDPSGLDMTRDNEDRLELFTLEGVEVRRIALNFDQVVKHKPPPNPAKLTDSRANQYIAEHGRDSWELDALEPKIIVGLVEKEIKKFRDADLWKEREEKVAEDRDEIRRLIGIVEDAHYNKED